MRKIYKKEDALKEIARNISKTIVIRSIINGNSYDTRRETTAPERDIIYCLAYGALLALNDSEEVRRTPAAERAIVHAAEYMVKLHIPECNGYDTLYIPLNEALETWEQEAEE